ncbi:MULTISPECIES: LacI family DNA-binding transcriptional regulator [Streptomyces]|uniref:LacI family DNA-binding transcriptional regulator n=1 Tax=Streptomyces lonegramiae TaxID=3075524 RepID=A0ABU2XFI8_9ACTN|nr:LacI family DNA-binding transcriptional regulator [Streptomyces sp. DSM 41529]MDT0544700.1 LacI family DNA-binding transcriptional regulator [Streptomyces sp. DSM 41529]
MAEPARTRRRRATAGSRVVMADVARLAGVSGQTVSRVLNDHPSVRQETRERVRAAMAELDYRPTASARTLASGRSRMLGVISFDATRFGPAAILAGINEAAQSAGYLVSTIALTAADRTSVAGALDRLLGEGADGVIAIAPQRSVSQALVESGHDIPLVTLDKSFGERVPVVAGDSASGARQATEHLLRLGHRTVWHIAGPVGWIAAEARLDGWRAALKDAGAVAPEPLFGDWSADSGYELGRRVAGRPEVTAVFVSNDQMAVGVLRALHEAGRRVPEDVSVVGYDDIPEAAHLLPPLTTVRTDFAEVGRRCLALMLDQLHHAPEPGVRVDIPTELVVRHSTGPAPAPAPAAAEKVT